jgi:hypothetical protein
MTPSQQSKHEGRPEKPRAPSVAGGALVGIAMSRLYKTHDHDGPPVLQRIVVQVIAN